MKKEIKIPTEGDQTAKLRELVENPDVTEMVLLNESDEPIHAEGLIPVDEEIYKRWSVGEYGVVRIERENLTVSGSNTLIYNTKPAVTIDAGLEDIGYWDRSLRKVFNIVDSKNININSFTLESYNVPKDSNSKPGFPEYHTETEFEHGFMIQNSQNINIENIEIKNVGGDGAYITGNETENVTFRNIIVNGNGRQGVAIAGGKRLLFDNVQVLKTRRGGFDLESPLTYHITDQVVIKNSWVRGVLQAFPMAGSGVVDNVLVKNNVYHTSGGSYIRATKGRASKKNFIFSGNYGIAKDNTYRFENVENILIEKEWSIKKITKEDFITLENCKNVTIRNNKAFNESDRIVDGLVINLIGTTQPSDVKVYDNDTDIYFLKDGEYIKAEEYTPTEDEKTSIPFDVPEFIQKQYYIEESKLSFLPEVHEHIEGYIGKVYLKGDEVEETPEPETPDTNTLERVKNLKVDWISSSGNIRITWKENELAEEYKIKRVINSGEPHISFSNNTILNIVGAGNIVGDFEIEITAIKGEDESKPSILKFTIPEKGEPEIPQPEPEDPIDEEPIEEELTDEKAIESLENILSYFKSKLDK